MTSSIEPHKKTGWRLRTLLTLGVASTAILAACGSSGGSSSDTTAAAGTTAAASTTGGSGAAPTTGGTPTTAGAPVKGNVNLVAYSTPQAAYEAIQKAFKATPQGKDVNFTQSYGASGDQSRAVAAGQPADLVAFSLEPDITRLVKVNMVADTWNANQYKGMVTNSVVVLAVRKGNPKHITG